MTHSQTLLALKTLSSTALGVGTAILLSACSQANTLTRDNPAEASAKKPAKNVILFIGDGMGISTITAARIFDGQSQGKKGEEHQLAFDKFENVALVKTYNTNAQVPDSAGTATAMMSGYKTNIGAVNVPSALLDARSADSCNPDALPPTLTKRAQDAGKAVGILSTARITHATPAAMYSHSPSRDLEADKDIQGVFAACTSIAQQMVESQAEVIMGGGFKEFSEAQMETLRTDFIYVGNKTEMINAKTGKLRGLFNRSHMSFEADRNETDEPSLAEMTSVAIDRLSSDEDGYVLMVEAGRVDHAHHGINAYRALTDAQALNEAVKVAVAKANDDTLILVTADHSHVFTMAGYPVRGNPILGLTKGFNRETQQVEIIKDQDGKPYTTLGYHNGPNVREADSPALTDNMVQAKDYRQQTAVNLGSETHGGEDVALYATGPGAEHVRGVMEQNKIYDVMAKAMGWED
ncbi:alkaline phosphatase [Hellea balneolensis]|uniref:alkaline phosphatase n=1 Tax=Hellea balneolensis TaxID=287478 RepID=UPI000421B897|nr:alkaline phosphatase [Hellea balneolensis]